MIENLEKPIPVMIVGLGRIASLLEDDPLREKPCTHAGAIVANTDCALVAGADIDEGRRSCFAKRYDVPVYADAAMMLKKEGEGGNPCKIFIIATHPDSHAYYCNLAAAMRIPVVICEKPLADSLRSARKIAELTSKPARCGQRLTSQLDAGNTQMKIITNHERRYAQDYRCAKSIIDEGKLGRLLSARASLFMGISHRLIDVLWHDGTHLVDAIMFLSGRKLKHKKCFGDSLASTNGTAYLQGALVRHGESSVPCLIESGAGRDHLIFEIEFSFSKGRLRIGNGLFEVWESSECAYAQGFRSLSKVQASFEGKTGYFSGLVQDAVRCVREENHLPDSSAADGLAVIEYLHSIR
jgi:predicted dehydrogenase